METVPPPPGAKEARGHRRSIGGTRLTGICAQIEQNANELGSDPFDDLRTVVAYLAPGP